MEVDIEKLSKNDQEKFLSGLSNLLKSFNKKFDYRDIKTYEDAVRARPVDDEDKLYPTDSCYIASLKKLIHIRKTMAPDFVPDYSNSSPKKWYGIFDLSSGVRFFDASCDYSHTITLVGSRLCLPTEEMCLYFSKQFIDFHSEILIVKK